MTILDVLSSSYGGDNSSGTASTSIYNYNVLELYERIVLACDTKVNPLSLARIASLVAFSLSTVRGNNGTTTSSTPADTITTTTSTTSTNISGIVKGRKVIQNVLEKPTVRLGSAPTLFLQSKLVLLALREITSCFGPHVSVMAVSRFVRPWGLTTLGITIVTNFWGILVVF